MTDSEARKRILLNIARGLPEALAHELSDSGISLALELEPGPLFALRDWDTLRELVMMIDSHSYLNLITGLNLDIAHWRIAGGDVQLANGERLAQGQLLANLRNDVFVRRRIVHAHIAGHHPKAHLGDIHLRDLNDPKRDFLPWIRLLQTVQSENRHQGFPRYSGYVSHEFEAAPDRRHVWDSVRKLRELLT